MSNADDCKIGFIGFGNMASAMADGWIAAGTVPPANLYACANRYEALLERTGARGMNACQSAAELVDAVDVVVIAIKPHLIDEVLSPLAERLAAKPILSVAAGWDCARYEELLPGTRHISTVPNTPVSICEGVIACERTHTLRDDDYASVRALLDAFGSVVEVESRLLSVAGTVGGCGPAFIAMVIEALGDAAVKHGIPRADAYRMVSQMVVGTGRTWKILPLRRRWQSCETGHAGKCHSRDPVDPGTKRQVWSADREYLSGHAAGSRGVSEAPVFGGSGGVMGQWACGGSVRGKLRTGGGECGCARHKPQGNYSGGPGYGASARAETQEKCKLFRKGTDRGMCGKAGRVCPGDRSHKLQRQIRPPRRTSVHDENGHINGNPGSFRSGGVPAVQIPGYDKCRSEAAVKGSMRKAAGNRLRMGDAERGAAFK